MGNAGIQSSCDLGRLYPLLDWSKNVLVLGIESTAHTFGVGIVSTNPPRILANVKSVYKPKRGGIHPREAAEHHMKNAPSVVSRALKEAGISIRDLDAIAVALGPGLGPALRVGASIARGLASYYSKPLVAVNHALAHIEIGRFYTCFEDPLVVYVSGGNTTIAAFAKKRYRVFGETLDIALGNLLDTFAREAGVAPPYVVEGVHVVDYYASKASSFVELPYVVKGQDVSFSGLLTAALRALARHRLEDVCLSLREIAYGAVVEVAERGLAQTRKREVLLVGGVAASPVLREKIKLMVSYHSAVAGYPPISLSGDNGAMIAWVGALNYMSGRVVDIDDSVVRQRWRLDETPVDWM